ncbi:MAG: tetratricopeptide repeat protein [Candidatus Binatia bacterium]
MPPGPAAVDARLGAILALVRLHRLDAAAKALDAIRRAPGAEAAVSIGQAAISLASGSAQIAADALAPAPAGAALTQLGRGEVAAARGDHDAARRAFTAASTAEPPVPWIRANAFVYASRLTSDAGSALGLLDQAVAADPLFLHAWTDRAVLLADAGRVADAQATLATAQALAPDDELVVALRAALDAPRPAVADVEAMAAAFTAGAKAKRLGTWEASKPALATVLMRDTLGPLSPRGQGAAFLAGLFAALDTNPRLRVAPRGITDALTTRLGLTPESLESPSTLQRLGAVLDTPALLLGGTYSVDGKAQLQLRLMSAIQAEAVTTLAEDLGDPARVTTAARAAADRIATAVRVKFPLHGEVTALSGDLLVLTVTAAHGVRVGDGFRVVADARPITVGDRTVGYQQRLVGTVTVTEVGETSSRAKPTTGGPFEAGQHVVEIAEP